MFLLLCILVLCALYLSSNFIRLLVRQARSPLRRLPGPPSPSFFMGNLGEMHDQENTNLLANWQAKYGPNFTYRGFIGGCRLMTCDPVAVAHILGNAYEYPKPDFVRDSLATMAAGHDGLLTSEGEMHKRQTPAFSYSHLQSLTPIFWEKADQLRDIWLQLPEKPVPTRVCFGYHFNSLSTCNTTNELAQAFSVIFSTARKFRVMTILQVWFPILRDLFRRNNTTMVTATETMRRIGLELVAERQRAVTDELLEKGEKTVDGDKTILGKDILSVLIRSSLTASLPQQMAIPEILSQISTFIAAGHETTSNALSWCLYALVNSPKVQKQLRRELRQLDGARDDQGKLQDAVMRCEYLDWVVREALRLHAPVTSTMRVCMRDEDEIPVDTSSTPSNPTGGYLDRHGIRRHTIRVKKHDIITIPIQAINNSEQIWGADAKVFRPERWANPPSCSNSIPGLYSNILTFLNGNPTNGNRACIGYKFALLEMKIFLYVLLRDLEFTIDPATVIEKRVNVVTRPFVKSEPHLGNQLPLYIRPAPSDSMGPTPQL
ncbi:cytochrome P450 [Hymenopellis radicata]|nr:cytochrome P450 [Hymenopellis radicata]